MADSGRESGAERSHDQAVLSPELLRGAVRELVGMVPETYGSPSYPSRVDDVLSKLKEHVEADDEQLLQEVLETLRQDVLTLCETFTETLESGGRLYPSDLEKFENTALTHGALKIRIERR